MLTDSTLVLAFALLAAAVAALAVYLARRPAAGADPAAMAELARTLSDTRADLAVVNERVSRLLQGDQQSATALTESTAALKAEIARVQQDLALAQARAAAREDAERRTADAVLRLETVIAGTHSRGAAGENIVDLVFSQLPPQWQARNVAVKGKVVEFGLRLPNDLIVPIDSKWAATDLLQRFLAEEEPRKKQDLRSRLEDAVLKKAGEVRKYLDPGVTAGFGLAVVPDAVYDVCGRAQAQCLQQQVVLVSYGLFVPYLLLVFQTALSTRQSVDLSRLAVSLDAAQASVKALQDELDGRFSRALTMLDNSQNDMRAHLGRAATSLLAVQMGATYGAGEVAPVAEPAAVAEAGRGPALPPGDAS